VECIYDERITSVDQDEAGVSVGFVRVGAGSVGRAVAGRLTSSSSEENSRLPDYEESSNPAMRWKGGQPSAPRRRLLPSCGH
jgi:hypothetical protein